MWAGAFWVHKAVAWGLLYKLFPDLLHSRAGTKDVLENSLVSPVTKDILEKGLVSAVATAGEFVRDPLMQQYQSRKNR